MESIEWLVFPCRACRREIKLSPAMASSSVVCPFCRTKVSVPENAPIIREVKVQSRLPSGRMPDDSVFRAKDDWEIGKRQTGGEVPFRERLASTAAPKMQPDAPDLPDVVRVNLRRRKQEQTQEDFDDPEVAERRRSSRRKRRSEGEVVGSRVVRSLVFAVIVLAGCAGWLGWKQFFKPAADPRPVAGPPPKPGSTLAPATGPVQRVQTLGMYEYSTAVRGTIARFLGAPSVEEVVKLARDRERVEPKIRAFYHEGNPWRPLEIKPLDTNLLIKAEDPFVTLYVTLANFEQIPITLERTDDAFLVDWEAFSGYGEMTWDELMTKRPAEPVLMRVVMEHSVSTDYFNGAFTDSSKYHCYLLRDVNSAHIISGYCAKDTDLDKAVRSHLVLQPPPASLYRAYAVIRVRYPATGATANQVEITEFVEDGWAFRPDKK